MYQGKRRKPNIESSIVRVVLVLVAFCVVFQLFFHFSADRMQGNARLASCQSNLKQLGLALTQYAQDSDGTPPPLGSLSTKRMWRETLYQYVKSVGVYRCPNDVYTTQIGDSPQSLPRSYAANNTGWDEALNKSLVITLVDVRGDYGPDWDMTSPFYARSSAWKLYLHKPSSPLFFHRPSAVLNVLFADGHVKRVAPTDTLAPVNLWTRDNAPFTGQDSTNAQAILTRAEKK